MSVLYRFKNVSEFDIISSQPRTKLDKVYKHSPIMQRRGYQLARSQSDGGIRPGDKLRPRWGQMARRKPTRTNQNQPGPLKTCRVLCLFFGPSCKILATKPNISDVRTVALDACISFHVTSTGPRQQNLGCLYLLECPPAETLYFAT